MRWANHFLSGALLFTLASCATEPYEYVNTVDEIPQGRGIFTGERGEAMLYRRPGATKEPEDANNDDE